MRQFYGSSLHISYGSITLEKEESVHYNDVVYGALDIHDHVWELFGDPLLERLRGISQDVLPVECNPRCTAVNRFQHSVGVWHLARRLCTRPEFQRLGPDLPLAALLHDAGNPPFSHSGDWFMRAAIGHDGETHLREVLLGSSLAGKLENLGADPERICDLVSGNAKPWSDLLAGTLDLDNLDNIIRYARAQGLAGVDYDPCRIVDAFRLSPAEDAIELDIAAKWEVRKWRAARRAVYANVYAEPHLGLAMMLHRALEISYLRGELPRSFWRLSDRAALDHLEHGSSGGTELARAVRRLQPYTLVASWDGLEVPFPGDWRNWRMRKAVADEAAETAGMEPWEAAAYLGIGNDAREVSLGFRDEEDKISLEPSEPAPVRIRIYLRREAGAFTRRVLEDVAAFARRAVIAHLGPPKGVVTESRPAGF